MACDSGGGLEGRPLTRSDLDYDLPPELIAQYPLRSRTGSRLMVVRREDQGLETTRFSSLPSHLRPGDLVVLNNTRVFPARLRGRRADTGGSTEIFLLQNLGAGRWRAMIRPGKRSAQGLRFDFQSGLQAEIIEHLGKGRAVVELTSNRASVKEALAEEAMVPLPPYIKRPPETADEQRYQTVFATEEGAVAAPTAGLHFDDDLLSELEAMGVQLAFLTLHVGPGTFEPLRREILSENVLEPEEFRIEPAALNALRRAKAEERRIVAVGTTSTRVLESLDLERGIDSPSPPSRGISGETGLFIFPPYRYRNVDALLTNFHLPESSLLSLVAAFTGLNLMKRAYRKAIRERYRFYSYGDAMLIV